MGNAISECFDTPVDVARGNPAMRGRPGLLTVIIGVMFGTNYVLAKFAVQHGATPVALYYWQLLGATFILLSAAVVSGKRLVLTGRYLRYYFISGLLGASAPSLLAYLVLQYIPAGVFTVLITLSPLFTFLFASLAERKLLPLRRLVGVLIGFAGVSLATFGGFSLHGVAASWTLLAIVTPLLLAANNVFRNRAYPAGADPMSLAVGTLLSQLLLLWPLLVLGGHRYSPLALTDSVDLLVLLMGALFAASLVLTLRLQRLTDGVGSSQIGYFITLTGVLAGAVAFDESIGIGLIVAIGVAFLGIAVTNGHIDAHTLRRLVPGEVLRQAVDKNAHFWRQVRAGRKDRTQG